MSSEKEFSGNEAPQSQPPLLKPNGQRAKQAITIMWIMLALEIVSLISGYFHFSLLRAIAGGVEVSEEVANMSDVREAAIAVIYTIVFFISLVVLIRWFKRAYYNLHQVAANPSYKLYWTVWGWFVPIVNIFIPYQIMREICQTAKLVSAKPISVGLISAWWSCWLASGFLGNLIFKSAIKKADTIEYMLSRALADMGISVVGIPFALLTIKIIKDYSKSEQLLIERTNSGEAV